MTLDKNNVILGRIFLDLKVLTMQRFNFFYGF